MNLEEKAKNRIHVSECFYSSDGSIHRSEKVAIDYETSLIKREMLTDLISDELGVEFKGFEREEILKFIISKEESILNILK
jgi:hypothetical protein